ncbi:unnamed protein product [Tilletia controversa]|uniref:CsbD-like domain-containing protein n=3 Tax=Tilletia TaxID=13289 RepID=A0A8X7MQQ6_9BASI|nr:hypothetical protein CF328_g4641 [Tilletia controversa]KAE8197964.1 hypothetical protein CF336_g1912 [Tilletia laevis]KAE8258848.1 hypothetical protein A4X03_0g4263 [Tilletia caries]KAE8199081.1 hypothetical protein CF335_g4246 [Tilletia laevis]KAE8245936.1 hypothetical protein A4X06_0g5316 [Tilletia controversa]
MSSTNTNASENSTLQNLAGHAQYVKGAAEEAVAGLTGSSDWASSADQDKQAGVQTIRQASSTDDSADKESVAAKACPVAGGGVGQQPTSQ